MADAFEQALVEQLAEFSVGDGLDDGIRVGPMINQRQASHVLSQIDDALARGARLLGGGEGHHQNFVYPTVLGGLDHGMDIMTTETFCPVACVVRCASEDEAVRLAKSAAPGDVMEALRALDNFSGVTGNFNYKGGENGDPLKPVFIQEIRRGADGLPVFVDLEARMVDNY